jgi:uncharacterized cupredoxin-like copper-binding protein
MKKSLFVLLFMMGFVLAACGGGGASPTINVTLNEFCFSPDTFNVSTGQEGTLHAQNDGAVLHDLVVMKFGETVGDNFDEEDKGNVFWEVEAGPGASVTETFTAPIEPGEYQIVCGIPGHFMAEMSGKLIVVAGE